MHLVATKKCKKETETKNITERHATSSTNRTLLHPECFAGDWQNIGCLKQTKLFIHMSPVDHTSERSNIFTDVSDAQ